MNAVPAEITKAWLEKRFGAPGAAGWSQTVTLPSGEQVFTRTGGPACLCWASAAEVVAELGDDRAEITGYFCAEGSTARMAEHAEGHDFALVDGRFIVDGWLSHVIGEGPCVLDLEDAGDLALALLIHEKPDQWTVQPNIMETEKT